MSIVDGYKKVKRYIQTDDGHELMSQWTSSDTVETDGKTLTETLATKADLDTNGKVKLEQIPKVALDNLIKVENDTARFALTTDDVQTGDTVKVLESDDGSGERMYLVVDDTKLDSEDGYTGYSATTTWETIEGKPDDIGQVIHITQAEYDALDDTKLTDDVVYMITDAEGGGSGGVSSWEDLQDKPTNLVYSEEGEATAIEIVKELTTNDIVDNLNSNDATKVLSAKQGAHLNYIMERVVGTDIAEYSEDSTYEVGDYCIYTDSLYRCHTAINTPIAFDNTGHWEITTFSNEIKTLNNKLGKIHFVRQSFTLNGNGIAFSAPFIKNTSNVFIQRITPYASGYIISAKPYDEYCVINVATSDGLLVSSGEIELSIMIYE